MKATGIRRRVDELGRIVIPKEIRKTARIKENDQLEFYINEEGGLILKKYSPCTDILDILRNLRDARDAMDEDNPFREDLANLITDMELAED